MSDLSWEQGRTEYFDLQALAGFCRAVAHVQTTRPRNLAEFKKRLTRHVRTGVVVARSGHALPFLPTAYDAWRNYGRVYRPVYLVYEAADSLEMTSLANFLLTLDLTSPADREQFYAVLSSRLRWPNPAFAGYSHRESPVYQLHVIVKLLLEHPGTAFALEDLARFLWCCGRSGGIAISGAEAPRRISAAFEAFQRRPLDAPPADRLRQFREMMSLFGETLFEVQRGSVTLVPARSTNPGDTLTRFCDPTCCLARPNADREVEIQLRGSLSAQPAPPPSVPGGPSFRTRTPAIPRPRGRRRLSARPRSRIGTRLGFFTVNAQNQIEAERLVRDQIIQACSAANLLWFARTTLEREPYEGLESPGADGRVFAGGTGVPEGYHEVKSKSGDHPFQFTRNEIRRILECARRGVGYHVWEVIFQDNGQADIAFVPNVQGLFPPGSARHDALVALFDNDPMPRGCQLAF